MLVMLLLLYGESSLVNTMHFLLWNHTTPSGANSISISFFKEDKSTSSEYSSSRYILTEEFTYANGQGPLIQSYWIDIHEGFWENINNIEDVKSAILILMG
jgi:hypothetical protein